MPTVIASRNLVQSSSGSSLENHDVDPLLSMGFRPFFLLASLWAVLLVPSWLFFLQGWGSDQYFQSISWHVHEMVFGFTLAVVAGFLLTAVSNWTGRRTVTGTPLLGLAVLWLLGRVAPLVPGLPPVLVALLDLAFLPALGIGLGRALIGAENRRNYQFLVMLFILTVCNALMHGTPLQNAGVLPASIHIPPRLGQSLALHVVTFMILVVGGRVIPMFTRNGAARPEVGQRPLLERWGLASFLLAVVLETVLPWLEVVAGAWFLAGALNLARMRSWGTRWAKAPLLWILHLGFAATAASFLFRGAATLGLVPLSAAVHLLTVGGIGGLTLGMMTRVSLGHSGRMLVAPKSMALAFLLLAAAMVVRVGGPLIGPSLLLASYWVSGVLWTLAFALLLAFGLRIWMSPRADR